ASSWMHERAGHVLGQNLAPLVRRTGRRLAVSGQAIAWIEEQRSSHDAELRRSAERARALLDDFQQHQLVNIFPGKENSKTNVLPLVIERFRGQYRICLITQDPALATNVLRSARDGMGTAASSVVAFRVGDDDRLERWEFDPSRFQLCTGPARADDSELPVSM